MLAKCNSLTHMQSSGYAVLCLVYLVAGTFSVLARAGELSPDKSRVTFLCSDWPPFEYYDNNNKLTGYSVDILQSMHDVLGLEPRIQQFPWARAYKMAQNSPNHAVFTTARTSQRESLFKWVGPIANREIYLWKLKSRRDIQVSTIDDVRNYLVGTVRGEAGEKQLVDMGFEHRVNINSVEKQSRNILLLYNRRIDFIYGLGLTTTYIIKKEGYDPNHIERSILLSKGNQYYFAFNKETPDDIVQKYQDALDEISKNGVLRSIQAAYGVPVN